jgi:hypothetical protein
MGIIKLRAELDDIVRTLNELDCDLAVKGKVYHGNNPYVLNVINNMLSNGDLALDDIVIPENSDITISDYEGEPYLFSDKLAAVTRQINGDVNSLDIHKRNKAGL